MKLWNVFKMEVFKNLYDQTNILVMLILMAMNILGGLSIENHRWSEMPGLLVILGWLSIVCSFAFVFIYPYQMARIDYKNKVMSMIIASGVSRVQYYFVKIGTILLFWLASVILLAVIPTAIVTRFTDFFISFDGFWVVSTYLLSLFFMLMTSVILVKGKGVTIFVFFGLWALTTALSFNLLETLDSIFWNINSWELLLTVGNLMVILIFGLIGILILRKQDL